MANELKEFRDSVTSYMTDPPAATTKKKGAIIAGDGLKITTGGRLSVVSTGGIVLTNVASNVDGAIWFTVPVQTVSGGTSSSESYP